MDLRRERETLARRSSRHPLSRVVTLEGHGCNSPPPRSSLYPQPLNPTPSFFLPFFFLFFFLSSRAGQLHRVSLDLPPGLLGLRDAPWIRQGRRQAARLVCLPESHSQASRRMNDSWCDGGEAGGGGGRGSPSGGDRCFGPGQGGRGGEEEEGGVENRHATAERNQDVEDGPVRPAAAWPCTFRLQVLIKPSPAAH